MFSSACVHVTWESWKLDLATFKRLVSCYEGGYVHLVFVLPKENFFFLSQV